MKGFDKIKKHLRNTRFRINLPLISYEVDLDQLINSRSIDERIKKLEEIRSDLQGAVDAVESLQSEALDRREEVSHLKETVQKLEADKNAAETLLKVPEESFARLLHRASSKGRTRGIIEGLVIGLVTGALSSLLIWYLTKGH